MAVTPKAPWHVGSNGATELTRNEAQSFARRIVGSQAYRDKLESRAIAGDLPPAVEAMLWHYAYGKPPDNVNVNVSQNPLTNLSPGELARLAQKTAEELAEVAELRSQLEGELSSLHSTHPTVQ